MAVAHSTPARSCTVCASCAWLACLICCCWCWAYRHGPERDGVDCLSGKLIFILGGARSGKTQHAQHLAAQLGGRVAYVATAEPGDDEMRERIARHRAARPAEWQTIEQPIHVGAMLVRSDADVVVLDCVTLLVSNVLLAAGETAGAEHVEAQLRREIDDLLEAWRGAQFTMIVVSNEVGMGLVPPYALGRIYRDVLGHANQQLAQAADEVIFMVAGLPM